jgi:hypothetical protein
MPNRQIMYSLALVTLVSTGVVQSDAAEQKNDGTVPVVTEQAPDYWRASKLIGIGVFHPQGEKIGSISEVLVDHNGVAQVAVIATGSFGSRKDVGVPFNALRWVSHENVAPQTYNAAPNRAPLTDILKPAAKKSATDAGRGYPDHAIINLTKAQAKNLPDFHYSRGTLITTTTPAGPAGPLSIPAGPAAPE